MVTSMKYLHIMLHTSEIHNGSVFNILDEIGIENHEFYALHNIYDKYKDKYSIHEIDRSNIVRTINSIENSYDIIFIHSMTLTLFEIYRLKMSVIKKIVWVVWGHDLYVGDYSYSNSSKKLYKKLLKKLYFKLYDLRLKNMLAIGIGFKYDALEIRKRFKNTKIVYLPYGYTKGKKKEIDDSIATAKSRNAGKMPLKIMIGHSLDRTLRHFEMMKKMERFVDENIILSLVLVGDGEYKKNIVEYAKKTWKNKLEIIDNSMSYSEYVQYIYSVDIAIMASEKQTGLGNLNLLMYMGKKIFVAPNGPLRFCMIFENIESHTIDEIDQMSFEEFVKPTEDLCDEYRYGSSMLDERNKLIAWENTLRELEG